MKRKWKYYPFITFPYNFYACWGICPNGGSVWKSSSHRTSSAESRATVARPVWFGRQSLSTNEIFMGPNWWKSESAPSGINSGWSKTSQPYPCVFLLTRRERCPARGECVDLSHLLSVYGTSQFSQRCPVSFKIYSTPMDKKPVANLSCSRIQWSPSS